MGLRASARTPRLFSGPAGSRGVRAGQGGPGPGPGVGTGVGATWDELVPFQLEVQPEEAGPHRVQHDLVLQEADAAGDPRPAAKDSHGLRHRGQHAAAAAVAVATATTAHPEAKAAARARDRKRRGVGGSMARRGSFSGSGSDSDSEDSSLSDSEVSPRPGDAGPVVRRPAGSRGVGPDRALSTAPGGLLEGRAEAGAQRGAGRAAQAAQRRGE